jgi:hypothetical protein
MTELRNKVLAHAERVIGRGQALSATEISRTLGLSNRTAAIRILRDLRSMGKLPPKG